MPGRGCPPTPPAASGRGERLRQALESGPSTPARDLLVDELVRVADRLDALDGALAAEPANGALLRAAAGQQQVMARLLFRLEKATPATQPVPLKENPLQALRREIAERKAGRTAG